jgi:hypothetical protein
MENIRHSAIRYSSQELMKINENRYFDAPKFFKKYKICFINTKRNRIDYFSWNPQIYWDLKQHENKKKSTFQDKNWRDILKKDTTFKKQKEKSKPMNQEINDNLKAKKDEIFQMAERAAQLSNELFTLHKKIKENENFCNDSINTVSSGYQSMNTTLNESNTEIIKDEINNNNNNKPQATTETTEQTNSIQFNIIEHVRKIYQNALLRSELNKINKN